jgi:hypothetical protein
MTIDAREVHAYFGSQYHSKQTWIKLAPVLVNMICLSPINQNITCVNKQANLPISV